EGPNPPPDLGGVVPCCAQAASSVTVTSISKRRNMRGIIARSAAPARGQQRFGMPSDEPSTKIFGCFITASITRLPAAILRRHSSAQYTLGLIARFRYFEAAMKFGITSV